MAVRLGDRMVLRPTDELEALPPCPTVGELIASDRGRWELLPAREVRASAWHPGAVGPKAGDFEPDWWADDPVIDSNPVHLFRLRNAYYVPTFGAVISAEGEAMKTSVAEASYRTPDLSLLPHASRVNEETVLDVPPDIDTLDRLVVSMPWGSFWNYGHFLLDCLPTVASIAEIPELDGYRFAFPSLSPWHRRHLQLLGVDAPVELDGPIYRVSDVIFASSMAHNLYRPNVNYRTVRDRQLARKRPTALSFAKIYLTRRELDDPKRIFLSDAALEKRLRALGFEIVAPERHTIDEQIDLFRNADVIVGCAGAAFANVLYCHEDATVVEITPASMVTPTMIGGIWVRNICAIVGCRWRPYYCVDTPPEEPVLVSGIERRELGLSFDLEVDDLVDFVESVTAAA
jgi:capsular polysaccharide biosynthesis protein